MYFCRKFADDLWTVGDWPRFRIQRECNLGASIGWAVHFGGSERACLDSGASASITAAAGLETVSSDGTDRNIDVKYDSVNVKFTGNSSWFDFDNNTSSADPSYSFSRVSSTAFNTYLAPLD